MLPATMFPDFQLAELMQKHRIPKRLREAFARYIRTGRRTKRLGRAVREAYRGPLDDNRFAMCVMDIQNRGLDNIADGIVSWTANGGPLRIVG